MRIVCPKCQSGNTYFQDGEWACMMCGKRWHPQTKSTKGADVSKIGECVNCKRTTSLVAHGMCGMCYLSVHNKHEKGTAAYEEALKKAREKCQEMATLPESESPRKDRKTKKEPAKQKDISTDEALKKMDDRRREIMKEWVGLTQAIALIEQYKTRAAA